MLPPFSIPAHCIDPDLRKAVQAARQLGFNGIELNVAHSTIDLTELSNTGRRELRHLLQASNTTLTALRADTGPAGLGPGADTDRVLDRADKLLNVTIGLGCGLLCLDLGRLPPAQRVEKPKPRVTEDMAGLLILPPSATQSPEPEPVNVPTKVDPALMNHWQQALSQLGEIADRYGAMIAFGTSLSSAAALVSLTRGVACPWFGIDLNPATVLGDDWPIEAVFDEASDLLRNVRLRDAVRGDAGRSKPAILGRGDVAWRPLFEMLLAADYRGPMVIDPSDLPDPRAAGVAGLKQLTAMLTA